MGNLKFRVLPSYFLALVVSVIARKSFYFFTYTLAIVLHEFAHYFVANKLFYQCAEIQLSAFGAVLFGEFDDAQDKNQILIALAGPVCNFVLAITVVALWWILPDSYRFTSDFAFANLSMGLVNLLPCYPLDGGKVLVGLLSLSGRKGRKVTKAITVGVSVVLTAIFVLSAEKNFSLLSFSVFLLCGCFENGSEYKRVGFGFGLNDKLNKVGMERKTIVFGKSATVSSVVKRLRANCLYTVEVVDEKLNVVCRVDGAKLFDQIQSADMQKPIYSVTKRL